jgi:hypothetical protein
MTLNNLGVSASIQNINQQDVKTITLNNFYNVALEQALKDFDWNFASTYCSLTPTGNDCLNPKYSYEYDYPNDCLAAREIAHAIQKDIPFEVASNVSGDVVINTNTSPATLRYTRRVDKEIFFPVEFISALSWHLAFLTAETLTGSTGKREKALSIYSGLISKAQIANTNEGYEEENITVPWLEAR